jgi:putative glycosyltransferase (TIGR04372 family)
VYFLTTQLRRFLRADILFFAGRLNFGNTAFLPDMARRMFPGRHLVFAIFREPAHNPYMREVWKGVEKIEYMDFRRFVIDVKIAGRRVIVPYLEPHDSLVTAFLGWVARNFGRNPEILTSRQEMYRRVEIPQALQSEVDTMMKRTPPVPDGFKWALTLRYAMYWELRRRHRMQDPYLPDHLREKVAAAIRSARGGRDQTHLCGLYLKKQARQAVAPQDGSPLEVYLPAIRLLVENGYQVLLTGDRPLPATVADSFDGMFVDAERVGIDWNLFNLFTLFNADIFIGETGAGLHLVEYNEGCPQLGVNTWPFWGALRGWIYYKHAFDADGAPLDISRIAGEFTFVVPEEGKYSVVDNSSDEILDAVTCFLEEVENPGSSTIDRELEDFWPPYSFFKLAKCHISPAYVRNYRQSISAQRPGSPDSMEMSHGLSQGVPGRVTGDG